MTIEADSVRYTDENGKRTVSFPSEWNFRTIDAKAQEFYDKDLHRWLRRIAPTPDEVFEDQPYFVYHNGVIVPWWIYANKKSGVIDVWMIGHVRFRLTGDVTIVKIEKPLDELKLID